MRGNPNDTFTPAGPWVRADQDVLHVTIGRNVGSSPLSDDDWALFQSATVDRISALIKPTDVFTFLGSGTWRDDVTGELISEESAHVTFLPGYTAQVPHIESILKDLADDYKQDAIAFSYGPANLARR